MEFNLFSMFDDESRELEQGKKELAEKNNTTSANENEVTEENKAAVNSEITKEGNDIDNGDNAEESEVSEENLSLLPDETKNKRQKYKAKKEENKAKPKVDPNKTVEDEIKKFPTVVVKAYGSELMVIEGETEVQAIKLSEISDRLINEFQYGEFAAGISWHAAPNNDKTVGYLVATGKFYAKG
ncbi:hypothetical protein GKZ28_08425 [Clostridium chromiireducens]|jgi:AAA ATPase containing von Willebrand factor type A (vWA) domain|uniref:Uncharacterized protein n=1 Tax=Clostridium chromiireducens TaxID=225345 RepID=A0A964RLP1_9CLOT|nr:hypothetical protein [Clostridium chromiireducens]MVX63720.1 hypothetical protein [Clostridium chromiireducens]